MAKSLRSNIKRKLRRLKRGKLATTVQEKEREDKKQDVLAAILAGPKEKVYDPLDDQDLSKFKRPERMEEEGAEGESDDGAKYTKGLRGLNLRLAKRAISKKVRKSAVSAKRAAKLGPVGQPSWRTVPGVGKRGRRGGRMQVD
ncbi:unnamed protein product [Pedinophyceae sp. YPF-701]|nr:unnamed protein product [Pedinophyceae sp. YPF-701]